MLSLEQVSFSYPGQPKLLTDISFKVEKGTILGILGHNGSGKTTLLRLISRSVEPDSGEIKWQRQNITDYSRSDYYNNLGTLIESPALYDHLSLRDNLDMFHRYRPSTNKEALYTLIDRLGLTASLSIRPGKFSTGMRQRTGLALGMYFSPSILLLDEPTTGLDPDGIILTRTLLREASSEGSSIIITGHHLSEIEKVADQFIILKNGKLIYRGPIEVARQYRDLEELYLSVTRNPQ